MLFFVRKLKRRIRPTLVAIDTFATRMLSFRASALVVMDGVVQAQTLSRLATSLAESCGEISGKVRGTKTLGRKLSMWRERAETLLDAARNTTAPTMLAELSEAITNTTAFGDLLVESVDAAAAAAADGGTALAAFTIDEYLEPVRGYATAVNATLLRVQSILASRSGDPSAEVARTVADFVTAHLSIAPRLNLVPRPDLNDDVARTHIEASLRTAIGGLVAFLTPLKVASRRMAAALADPALAEIDAVTASYLAPSLALNVPESMRPDPVTSARLLAALSPEAQRAYAEVRAATTLLAARSCRFADDFGRALNGSAVWFTVPALPAGMRALSTCVAECDPAAAAPCSTEAVPCEATLVDSANATVPAGFALQLVGQRHVLVPLGYRVAALAEPSPAPAVLSALTLQRALGNTSGVITRLQAFISLVTDGPASASALAALLTEELQPSADKLQGVADEHIVPALGDVRLALEGALNLTQSAADAARAVGDYFPLLEALGTFSEERLPELVGTPIIARGFEYPDQASFLYKTTRLYNTSRDLLANGLVKIYAFMNDTVGIFGERITELEAFLTEWSASGIVDAVGEHEEAITEMEEWMVENVKTLTLIDLFGSLAMTFAEATRDMPFGDQIYGAVRDVVAFIGGKRETDKLLKTMQGLIERVKGADEILELLWTAVDESGLIKKPEEVEEAEGEGEAEAATERRLSARLAHARRMAALAPKLGSLKVHRTTNTTRVVGEARMRMLAAHPHLPTQMEAARARLLRALPAHRRARLLQEAGVDATSETTDDATATTDESAAAEDSGEACTCTSEEEATDEPASDEAAADVAASDAGATPAERRVRRLRAAAASRGKTTIHRRGRMVRRMVRRRQLQDEGSADQTADDAPTADDGDGEAASDEETTVTECNCDPCAADLPIAVRLLKGCATQHYETLLGYLTEATTNPPEILATVYNLPRALRSLFMRTVPRLVVGMQRAINSAVAAASTRASQLARAIASIDSTVAFVTDLRGALAAEASALLASAQRGVAAMAGFDDFIAYVSTVNASLSVAAKVVTAASDPEQALSIFTDVAPLRAGLPAVAAAVPLVDSLTDAMARAGNVTAQADPALASLRAAVEGIDVVSLLASALAAYGSRNATRSGTHSGAVSPVTDPTYLLDAGAAINAVDASASTAGLHSALLMLDAIATTLGWNPAAAAASDVSDMLDAAVAGAERSNGVMEGFAGVFAALEAAASAGGAAAMGAATTLLVAVNRARDIVALARDSAESFAPVSGALASLDAAFAAAAVLSSQALLVNRSLLAGELTSTFVSVRVTASFMLPLLSRIDGNLTRASSDASAAGTAFFASLATELTGVGAAYASSVPASSLAVLTDVSSLITAAGGFDGLAQLSDTLLLFGGAFAASGTSVDSHLLATVDDLAPVYIAVTQVPTLGAQLPLPSTVVGGLRAIRNALVPLSVFEAAWTDMATLLGGRNLTAAASALGATQARVRAVFAALDAVPARIAALAATLTAASTAPMGSADEREAAIAPARAVASALRVLCTGLLDASAPSSLSGFPAPARVLNDAHAVLGAASAVGEAVARLAPPTRSLTPDNVRIAIALSSRVLADTRALLTDLAAPSGAAAAALMEGFPSSVDALEAVQAVQTALHPVGGPTAFNATLTETVVPALTSLPDARAPVAAAAELLTQLEAAAAAAGLDTSDAAAFPLLDGPLASAARVADLAAAANNLASVLTAWVNAGGSVGEGFSLEQAAGVVATLSATRRAIVDGADLFNVSAPLVVMADAMGDMIAPFAALRGAASALAALSPDVFDAVDALNAYAAAVGAMPGAATQMENLGVSATALAGWSAGVARGRSDFLAVHAALASFDEVGFSTFNASLEYARVLPAVALPLATVAGELSGALDAQFTLVRPRAQAAAAAAERVDLPALRDALSAAQLLEPLAVAARAAVAAAADPAFTPGARVAGAPTAYASFASALARIVARLGVVGLSPALIALHILADERSLVSTSATLVQAAMVAARVAAVMPAAGSACNASVAASIAAEAATLSAMLDVLESPGASPLLHMVQLNGSAVELVQDVRNVMSTVATLARVFPALHQGHQAHLDAARHVLTAASGVLLTTATAPELAAAGAAIASACDLYASFRAAVDAATSDAAAVLAGDVAWLSNVSALIHNLKAVRDAAIATRPSTCANVTARLSGALASVFSAVSSGAPNLAPTLRALLHSVDAARRLAAAASDDAAPQEASDLGDHVAALSSNLEQATASVVLSVDDIGTVIRLADDRQGAVDMATSVVADLEILLRPLGGLGASALSSAATADVAVVASGYSIDAAASVGDILQSYIGVVAEVRALSAAIHNALYNRTYTAAQSTAARTDAVAAINDMLPWLRDNVAIFGSVVRTAEAVGEAGFAALDALVGPSAVLSSSGIDLGAVATAIPGIVDVWALLAQTGAVRSSLGLDGVATVSYGLTALQTALQALLDAVSASQNVGFAGASASLGVACRVSSIATRLGALVDAVEAVLPVLDPASEPAAPSVVSSVLSQVDAALLAAQAAIVGVSVDQATASFSVLGDMAAVASKLALFASTAAGALRVDSPDTAGAMLLQATAAFSDVAEGVTPLVRSALRSLGVTQEDTDAMAAVVDAADRASIASISGAFAPLRDVAAAMEAVYSAQAAVAALADSASGVTALALNNAVSTASASSGIVSTRLAALSAACTAALAVEPTTDFMAAIAAMRDGAMANAMSALPPALDATRVAADAVRSLSTLNEHAVTAAQAALTQAAAAAGPLIAGQEALSALVTANITRIGFVAAASSDVLALLRDSVAFADAASTAPSIAADAVRTAIVFARAVVALEGAVVSAAVTVNASSAVLAAAASSTGEGALARVWVRHAVAGPVAGLAASLEAARAAVSTDAAQLASGAAAVGQLVALSSPASMLSSALLDLSSLARRPASCLRLLDAAIPRIVPLLPQGNARASTTAAAAAAIEDLIALSSVDLATLADAFHTAQAAMSLLRAAASLSRSVYASDDLTSEFAMAMIARAPEAVGLAALLSASVGISREAVAQTAAAGQRTADGARLLRALVREFMPAQVFSLNTQLSLLNASLPQLSALGSRLVAAANSSAAALVVADDGSPSASGLSFAAIREILDVASQMDAVTGSAPALATTSGLLSAVRAVLGADGNSSTTADVSLTVATLRTISRRLGAADPNATAVNVTAIVQGDATPSIFSASFARAFSAPSVAALEELQAVLQLLEDAVATVPPSLWTDLTDAVSALGDASTVLSGFVAVEDALLGVGSTANARASLDAVLVTLSNIGRTIAGAVRGGVAGVTHLVVSAEAAHESLSKLAMGSVDKALPLPSDALTATRILASYAPTGRVLADTVVRLTTLVMPEGDQVVMTLPWGDWPIGNVSVRVNASGAAVADVRTELQRLPELPTTDRLLAQLASLHTSLVAGLTTLQPLYDAGDALAFRAGLQLTSLGDASALPFNFASVTASANTVEVVTTRLSSMFAPLAAAFANTTRVLRGWQARGSSPAMAVELATLTDQLMTIKDAATASLATANALFADVRGAVDAVSDWNGVLDALDLIAQLNARASEAATALVTPVRAVFAAAAAAGMMPGDVAVWADKDLAALAAAIPRMRAVASYTGEAFLEVRASVAGGVLASVYAFETSLVRAIDALDYAMQTAALLANTATTLTATQVADRVERTLLEAGDAGDLIAAVAAELSSGEHLSAALQNLATMARSLIRGANLAEYAADTLAAMPLAAIEDSARALRAVASAIPAGFTNARSVVSSVLALQDAVGSAASAYWALKGADVPAITAALPLLAGDIGRLQAMLSNITTVDTLYRVAVSLTSANADDVGRLDLSGELAVASPRSRAGVVEGAELLMPIVSRAASLLGAAGEDAARLAAGEPTNLDPAALVSEAAAILSDAVEAFTELQQKMGQVVAVAGIFSGAGYGRMVRTMERMVEGIHTAAAAPYASLARVTTTLAPITSLGSGVAELVAQLSQLASVAQTTAALRGPFSEAVQAAAGAGSDEAAAILTALPTAIDRFGELVGLVEATSTFYSNHLEDVDAADALRAQIAAGLEQPLAALAPLNVTSNTTLFAALDSLAAFVRAADLVVRVRSLLQLDTPGLLLAASDGVDAFARLQGLVGAALAAFGVPAAHLSTAVSAASGASTSVKDAYAKVTQLKALGADGFGTLSAQTAAAVGHLATLRTSLAFIQPSVNHILTARMSPRGATAFDKPTLEAVLAAARSGAVALATAEQAVSAVAADLAASGAALPSRADDEQAAAAGQAVLALDAAANGLGSAIAALQVALPGTCAMVAAVGDVAAVARVVASAQSTMRVFDGSLASFVRLVADTARLVAGNPQLAAVTGPLAAAQDAFSTLADVVSIASVSMAAPLPASSSLGAVNATLMQLCGSAASLRAALAAVQGARGAFLGEASDGASGAAVLSSLTATASTVRSVQHLLADGLRVSATLAGARDVSVAAVAVASLRSHSLAPVSFTPAQAQAWRLHASLDSMIAVLGAPEGSVAGFLRAAGAVDRLAALSRTVSSLYTSLGTSAAGRQLFCTVRTWLAQDSDGTDGGGARRLQYAMSSWSLQGGATQANTSAQSGPFPLQLTTAAPGSAGSAFTRVTIGPSRFSARFTFRIGRATGASLAPGEGLVFVIHRDPRGGNATGSSAEGCMGYCGIANSWGVRFDVTGEAGLAVSTAGIVTGGLVPTAAGEWAVQAVLGLGFPEGDTVANVVYEPAPDGSSHKLTVAIVQTASQGRVANAAFSTPNAPALAAALGCVSGMVCDAFIGFTAATSAAAASRISLSNFSTSLWSSPLLSQSRSGSATGSPTTTGTPSGSPLRLSRSRSATASPSRGASFSGTGSVTASATASITAAYAFELDGDAASSATPTVTATSLLALPPLEVPEECDGVAPVNASAVFASAVDAFEAVYDALAVSLNATRGGNVTLSAGTPELLAALDAAEAALEGLASLADAAEQVELLGAIAATLAATPVDSLARSSMRDDVKAVYDLLDGLGAALSGNASALGLVTPLLERLQRPMELMDAVDVTVSLSTLVSTAQSALAAAHAPDLAPVLAVLRLAGKQRAAISLVRKVLPSVTALSGAAGQLPALVDLVRGVTFDAASNAAALNMLSRFRGSLVAVTRMFVDLYAGFEAVSGSVSSTGVNISWAGKAEAVISTLDAALSSVGSSMEGVADATAAAQGLLDSLATMRDLGLATLGDRVAAAVALSQSLPVDDDVATADVGDLAGEAAAALDAAASLPRLLLAVGDLVTTPASGATLAPIRAIVDAVAHLSGVRNTFVTLAGIGANASAVAEQTGLLSAALSSVAGGDASTSMGAIRGAVTSFGSALTTVTDGLDACAQYLDGATEPFPQRIRRCVALAFGRSPFPSTDEAYQRVADLLGLLGYLGAWSNGTLLATADAAAGMHDALARLTAGLTDGSALPGAGGALGVGSTLAYSLESGVPAVLGALANLTAYLASVQGIVDGLPEAAVGVQTLYRAVSATRDLGTSVRDVVRRLSLASDMEPAEISAVLGALRVNTSDVRSLFSSGATFFTFAASLRDAAVGMAPLMGVLADAQAFCPASGNLTTSSASLMATLQAQADAEVALAAAEPAILMDLLEGLSTLTAAPGSEVPTPVIDATELARDAASGARYLDALQCVALATVGMASNASITVVSAGRLVALDGTRCWSAARLATIPLRFTDFFLSSRLPATALTIADALSSIERTYAVVRNALPSVSRDNVTTGLAANTTMPPLPGLGFCFSPNVLAGPCATIRARLARVLRNVSDSIERLQLAEPLAVKALAAVFDPQMNASISTVAQNVAPWFAQFVRDTDTFAIAVVTAMADTPSRRRLAAPLSSADALDDVDGEAGATVPRHLQASFTGMLELTRAAHAFAFGGQALLQSLGAGMADLKLRELTYSIANVTTATVSTVAALDWVMPWANTIFGAMESAGTMLEYFDGMGEVKAIADELRPRFLAFLKLFLVKNEPIMHFMGRLNDTVTRVDAIYLTGKAIFKRWWDIDQWIEIEAAKRLTIMTSGKDSAELAPWDTLPYCSAELCMRQETRGVPAYKDVLFYMRYLEASKGSVPLTYISLRRLPLAHFLPRISPFPAATIPIMRVLQFYDLSRCVARSCLITQTALIRFSPWGSNVGVLTSQDRGAQSHPGVLTSQVNPFSPLHPCSPPIFTGGVTADLWGKGADTKIMEWTIGGLYERWRPNGVMFWGQEHVVVCYQYVRPADVPEEDDPDDHASVLAFYPRKSKQIYKLVELWEDKETPFLGTCSGLALARDYLYVSDIGSVEDQEGFVLGFNKADVDAQLAEGRAPGKIYMADSKGWKMKLTFPYTASARAYYFLHASSLE